MFSSKNESEIAFATRFFAVTTWIAKLQIKQLVERPLQILTHYEHKSWIALQLLWMILFRGFQDFLIYRAEETPRNNATPWQVFP